VAREHGLIIVLRSLTSPVGTRSGEMMHEISLLSEKHLLGLEEAETFRVEVESSNLSE
jgi:hypothetical protein